MPKQQIVIHKLQAALALWRITGCNLVHVNRPEPPAIGHDTPVGLQGIRFNDQLIGLRDQSELQRSMGLLQSSAGGPTCTLAAVGELL